MATERPSVVAMRDELVNAVARICPEHASRADVLQAVGVAIEHVIRLWAVSDPWESTIELTPRGREILKEAEEAGEQVFGPLGKVGPNGDKPGE